ncbi:MAG: McrC family protein [Eubacterium sp.]
MKQLKIKDNSKINKSEFFQVSKITCKVADKTLDNLEREGVFVFPGFLKESKDLTKDQIILQSYNDTYRSGNVMGFLGLDDERLIIESRFGCANNDYFLKYLLQKVIEIPNVLDFDADANPDSQMLDLFVFLFPFCVKKALRKGLFKTYVTKEYNDSNPNGTIDIARHIKMNTPYVGKIAYNQREYSYDNYLTELVRHTLEFIKKKPYGRRILSQINDESKLIVEATQNYQLCDKQKIIDQNKKNVIQHAYYHEYRALQYLCILILQNKKHQIGTGINRVYGILFDGAWLWEEYINLLVKDLFYHPMNKEGKGAQRLFDGNIGLIYPDFISKNSNERIIADAKYKPIGNINNSDYFQVLTYMMRFDAKTGVYFYPDTENFEEVRLWVNKGLTYEKNVAKRDDISIIKHGLIIPNNAKSYNDFSEMMKKSEDEFVRKCFDFNRKQDVKQI